MDKTKPFGLIISKRSQSFRPTTSAVFGSDSDDEPTQKKMPKIPQAKPIKPEPCEDPSIYEYDSVYDDMKAKEVAKIAPKDANKPSKYIGSLLKAADKRKKDQERRVEKKVHHEREKEGDKFKDKEAFVTSSYKKKMEEMEEEEERERRENMLNDMMDVTKQKDLNGFYRHFLKQCVGEEKVPVFGERYSIKQEDGIAIKEEKLSDEEAVITKTAENIDQDSDLSSSSDGEKEQSSLNDDKSLECVDKASKKYLTKDRLEKRNRPIREKNYRRNVSNVGSKVTEKETLLANDVDQDSDNSSSEEECLEKSGLSKDLNKRSSKKNDEDLAKKRKKSPEKSHRNIRKRTEDDDSLSEDPHSVTEDEKTRPTKNGAENDPKLSSNSEEKDIPLRKTREDIFAKRTVGEMFAEAQARYFQRMAARSG